LFKRKKSPRFRRHAFALPFVLIAELEDTVATTPAFVAPLGIRPKGMGPHHSAFLLKTGSPNASPKIAAH
jgi:hypothetical protein